MGLYPDGQPFEPFYPGLSDQSAYGPMQQMLFAGLSAMGSSRGMPLFGVSERNMFDRIDQMRLTDQHRQMVSDSARLEQSNVVDLFRNTYGMAGIPFGADQLRGAQRAAGAYASMAPYLIPMFPKFFDDLSGGHSPSVFSHFAANVAENRLDPVTGRLAVAGDSMNAGMRNLNETAYRELFANGNYMNTPFTSYQGGAGMQALQMQGLLPSVDRNSFKVNGQAMGDMSPAERDRLLKVPEVQQGLREFDSKRVISSLREWGDALTAMKEVFGDAGQPNAPMPVLMAALNQFTSGGMQSMNPRQIASQVRQTAFLADKTGIGMEAAMQLQAQQAQLAQQLNLSPTVANWATQEGLAFARGFQAQGSPGPTWGLSDISHLTQRAAQLATSALASQGVNQIGMGMRASEMGNVTKGSEAAAFLEAAKKGQTTFNFGPNNESHNVAMNQAAFIQMMVASSGGQLNSNDVRRMLEQTTSNQEPVSRNPDVAESIVRSQGAALAGIQMSRMSGNTFNAMIKDSLGRSGGKLATALGRGLSSYLMGDKIDHGIMVEGHRLERDKVIGGELGSIIDAQATAGDADAIAFNQKYSKGSTARAEQLAKMAEEGVEQTDTSLRRTGQGTLADNMALHDPRGANLRGQAKAEAVAAGVFQQALAPLGKGGMMRRFMDGLISGRATDLSSLAAETVGGVQGEDIRRALGGGLNSLQTQFQDLKKSQEDYLSSTDSERSGKYDALKEKATKFEEAMENANKTLEKHGLVYEKPGGAVDSDSPIRTAEHMRRLIASGKLNSKEYDDVRNEHRAGVNRLVSGVTGDVATMAALASRGGLYGIMGIRADEEAMEDHKDASGAKIKDEQDRLGTLHKQLDSKEVQSQVTSYRNRLANADEDTRKTIEGEHRKLLDAVGRGDEKTAKEEIAKIHEQMEKLPDDKKESKADADGGKHYTIARLVIDGKDMGHANLILGDEEPHNP